jgi:hypothetical protein
VLALALTAATCTAKPFPDATWNARPTAPAWLSQPDLVLDVRWFRNASSPAFLFAGVCQLFMRDDAGERDLRAGAPAQVGACARQAAFQKVSLPVGVPAADVRRIQFHFTDTPGVGRMYGELVDEPPAPAVWWSWTANTTRWATRSSTASTGRFTASRTNDHRYKPQVSKKTARRARP